MDGRDTKKTTGGDLPWWSCDGATNQSHGQALLLCKTGVGWWVEICSGWEGAEERWASPAAERVGSRLEGLLVGQNAAVGFG